MFLTPFTLLLVIVFPKAILSPCAGQGEKLAGRTDDRPKGGLTNLRKKYSGSQFLTGFASRQNGRGLSAACLGKAG